MKNAQRRGLKKKSVAVIRFEFLPGSTFKFSAFCFMCAMVARFSFNISNYCQNLILNISNVICPIICLIRGLMHAVSEIE